MSKRRVPPTRQLVEEPRRMHPALALGISALVVALVIAAGIGVDWVASPHPSAAFASCRTARQLAPDQYAGAPPMCIDPSATYHATLHTTKGDITIAFLPKQTPKTVNNFIVLAQHGFFDGQTFWQTESWVVQSGDPLNNGRGGPGYTLPPEPIAADEQWAPGSLGMARFPDGTINGSQFFILKSAWQGGNPTSDYNHFATVTTGLDVVGQLTTSDRILGVDVKKG